MSFPTPNPPPPRRGLFYIAGLALLLCALLFAAGGFFALTQKRAGSLAENSLTPSVLSPTGTALRHTSVPTAAITSVQLAPNDTPDRLTETPDARQKGKTFVPTVTPRPSPSLPKPRIFVAVERSNTVEVYDGEPPNFVTSIAVGIFPHNLSVSNDGRYLGVDDRHSDQISIVDTRALTEVARIHVGHQPHDLSWAPDDKRLYVTQERDDFISVIDTTKWETLAPIYLDSPTHDLTISPDGREIWATTIRYRGLLIIDRRTEQVIERLAYFPHGSHDAYFSPDGREVWVTSSGFIENESQADANVVIFDAATRAIKKIVPMGEYPFHSVKRYRDGLFLPSNSKELWFSDRGLGGVILVSTDTHQVLDSIKTGRAPFHLSFGPNGLLYVANHDDWTFSVIDPMKRQLLHTVPTGPDPHGIVVIAAP